MTVVFRCQRVALAIVVAALIVPAAPAGNQATASLAHGRLVRMDDMVFEAAGAIGTTSDERQPYGAFLFSPGASTPWTNGIVPVEFDAGVTQAEQTLFFSACLEWSARADVSCRPRGGEAQFARVTKNPGCYSYVGMTVITPSILNLQSPCWQARTIIHELGHLLGMWHEHQRSDRDTYLSIFLENVEPGKESLLDRMPGTANTSSYDFESVMHYSSGSLSARPLAPTFLPKPGYEAHTGTMGGFSRAPTALDGVAMSAIYGPPVGPVPAPAQLQLTMTDPDTARLTWARGVGGGEPTEYSLVVGNLPSWSDFGTFPQGLSSSLTVSIPPGLPTLFVRIAASNAHGRTESNEVAVFGSRPGPPRPIMQGQTGRNPIALEWITGAGAPVSEFVLHAGSRPGLSDIAVVSMGNQRSLAANVPEGRLFYVRVAAKADSGVSTSGDIQVGVGRPSFPVLQPPVVSGNTVTLSWTGGVPSTGYRLIARLAPTGRAAGVIDLGTVTGITIPGVPAGTYYLTVWARNIELENVSNTVTVTVP